MARSGDSGKQKRAKHMKIYSIFQMNNAAALPVRKARAPSPHFTERQAGHAQGLAGLLIRNGISDVCKRAGHLVGPGCFQPVCEPGIGMSAAGKPADPHARGKARTHAVLTVLDHQT